MDLNLFKYIFENSKKDGFKGIVSAIYKISAFFISISPIPLYSFLFQKEFIKELNKEYSLAIVTTIMIGVSCICFTFVFLCSKVFGEYITVSKLKKKTDMQDNELLSYYLKKSLIITVIFQGVIDLLLLIIYFDNNKSELSKFKIEDLFWVILLIAIYAISACVLGVILHLKYKKIKKGTIK